MRHAIETFWKEEHLRRGYQIVYTPHIASVRTYQRSGHLENYGDLMYSHLSVGESFNTPLSTSLKLSMSTLIARALR